MPATVTPVREQIDQAARDLPRLYVASVLDQAAALLADLYATGGRHDIEPDGWPAYVADLPRACLTATAQRVADRNLLAVPVVAELLDQVAAQLATHGIPTRRPGIIIRRTEHMPPAGERGRQDLALHITLTGWSIGPHPDHGHPLVGIVATHDPAGAQAVADLVAALAAGELPADLFRRM